MPIVQSISLHYRQLSTHYHPIYTTHTLHRAATRQGLSGGAPAHAPVCHCLPPAGSIHSSIVFQSPPSCTRHRARAGYATLQPPTRPCSLHRERIHSHSTCTVRLSSACNSSCSVFHPPPPPPRALCLFRPAPSRHHEGAARPMSPWPCNVQRAPRALMFDRFKHPLPTRKQSSQPDLGSSSRDATTYM